MSGDEVRAVMKDVDDRRPVVDLIWFHDDYLTLFAASDLELIARHTPLGRDDEPYAWVTETSISPWAIYVLKGTNHAERDLTGPSTTEVASAPVDLTVVGGGGGVQVNPITLPTSVIRALSP